MKTANSVCEKCGAKISGDPTREVCPACLLESGLRLAEDEPVAAVVDSRLDDLLSASEEKKLPDQQNSWRP
jgi:hypothetical protein